MKWCHTALSTSLAHVTRVKMRAKKSKKMRKKRKKSRRKKHQQKRENNDFVLTQCFIIVIQ